MNTTIAHHVIQTRFIVGFPPFLQHSVQKPIAKTPAPFSQAYDQAFPPHRDTFAKSLSSAIPPNGITILT